MLTTQIQDFSTSQIETILPNCDASEFFQLMDRPTWFMDHFIPAFDTWRVDHNGIIFLAYEMNHPVGSIYVELNPPHLVHGENLPIFGWFECKNQRIANQLLQIGEQYVARKWWQRITGTN